MYITMLQSSNKYYLRVGVLYQIQNTIAQLDYFISDKARTANVLNGLLSNVDAMEVLIKYCINSFPQVDQFIRIQISFYFVCVSYWSIGSETKSNWLI
jgi:uncharacterized protein YfcZ (UPF0381/DUF406 family)